MSSCPSCGVSVIEAAKDCVDCGTSLEGTAASPRESPPVDEPLAEALGSRYKIISKLGSGAFGEVYKARDTMLNRVVAVKRIRIDEQADEAQRLQIEQRFLREAQVAARLNHPNIVTIHDIISTPTMNLIVMEFVNGFTLEWMLKTRNRLHFTETVDILSRVADALDHAHRNKVVHRDVKPGNIMIMPTDQASQVKVTDFGIAKAEFSADITTAGSLVGTPNYMSPEQARGAPMDGRSDLFSLGCVLSECLAGRKPFQGNSLTDVLLRVVSEAPHPLDIEKLGLPAKVRTLVDRSLAKDPLQRFGTGAELIGALRSITVVPPTQPLPPDAPSATVVDGEGQTVSQSSDSIADKIMSEARSTSRMESHLRDLLQENRRLCLTSTAEDSYSKLHITPEEAFLLSRIDGKHSAREIAATSPLSELETARTLMGFSRVGIISLEGDPVRAKNADEPRSVKPQLAEPKPAKPKPVKPKLTVSKSTNPDMQTRPEIEQLSELMKNQDHWQVLGLEDGASREQIKKAFQKKAFLYHPDRYGRMDDPGLQKKLSFIINRVNEAYGVLSQLAEAKANANTKAQPTTPGKSKVDRPSPTPSVTSPPPARSRSEQAKEIFEQAKKLFDNKKYWEAIGLCRSAIELQDDQAEYYYILGLALSKNEKWRREAEDNFQTAVKLQPHNSWYLGALGELYEQEGLHKRAKKMFQQARTINPSYSPS